MIKNKADLHEYMSLDMKFFKEYSKRDQLIYKVTKDPAYLINKYVVYLRKEEYYFNTKRGSLGTLFYLYYFRRKNVLGNKLGFKIPKNCFDAGLTIYHHGEIIVNETAKIGKNCILHGGNCIGNNGIVDKSPVIGDNLDLGIGATIIGDVSLGDNIRVGSNAVVTHSFEDSNIILAGIPAKQIRIER